MRIVSLVPSATETLLAWGIEPIAVTRFCEQGDRFPMVGGTKDPHLEEIVSLRPDLVVMCDQENRLADAEALEREGVMVHGISITSLPAVVTEMRRLASRVGLASDRGDACAVGSDAREAGGMRAYVPIWRRPWMAIGADTYAASLLASLGVPTVPRGSDRYPSLDPAGARAAGATIVLAPSEPYPFAERHRGELEQAAPVVFVDGQDLFWWGVRTPLAHARLAAVLAAL